MHAVRSDPPARLAYFAVDGYPLTYQEAGAGAPLLLVHGSLVDYRAWASQVPVFAATYRTMAVSLRHCYPEHWDGAGNDFTVSGHADDLAAFILGRKLGAVHVVGHSRGGAVAIHLAQRHPALVRSLVLADPGGLEALLPDTAEGREMAGESARMFAQLRDNLATRDAVSAARAFVVHSTKAPPMTPAAVHEAANLLVQARRTGVLLGGFPAACRPSDVDEAHAIQDATVNALNETVAGWKVGLPLNGQTVHGAILQSRVIPSGGAIRAALVPLLGMEAEISFRFDQDLKPRERPYAYEEVAAAVTAFPAIEIVDSRFRDYRGTPVIERLADCMSNGGFVQGAPQPRWREFDLTKIEARLELDGGVLVSRAGGHPTGDPLLPAVELVNAMRLREGVRAGQVVTTGSYTGLNFAKPGQRVSAIFEGFGSATVHLTA